MTTRFSLSELAEMLHVPVEHVRMAVDALSAHGELTAESFQYGDRNWRIAPSDTKRLQAWIVEETTAGRLAQTGPTRRIRKKQVISDATSEGETDAR